MRRAGTWLSLLAAGVLVACGEQGQRVPVGPSLSSAPTVSLTGPSTVYWGSPCEWYGQITGGTAPYTWSWSQSDGGAGYPQARTTTLQSYITSSNWDRWTIYLTVTDAWGRTASASKTINASYYAPECYI